MCKEDLKQKGQCIIHIVTKIEIVKTKNAYVAYTVPATCMAEGPTISKSLRNLADVIEVAISDGVKLQ